MKKADIFDVLIVYSSRVAKSASRIDYRGITPFPIGNKHSDYHNSYAYLLQECERQQLKAAFATSEDIIGSGVCKSYWLFKANTWQRIQRPCKSRIIFDKFFPKNDQLRRLRELMFSSSSVAAFSNTTLFSLFSDKLRTHDAIPTYAIPTVNIPSGDTDYIDTALLQLATITSGGRKSDYSTSIIVKDRFGGGGSHIYKIDENFVESIRSIVSKNQAINFVVQPYIQFEKGLKLTEEIANTEIRLIFLGGSLIQTYFRSAQKDGFMCNQGVGGIELSIDEVPKKVITAANTIVKNLHEPSAFFALDFIISNSGFVYLLEGNISPGIDWNTRYPHNVAMNKKVINSIVGEISRRASLQTDLPFRYS